jgi:hypothetical protein
MNLKSDIKRPADNRYIKICNQANICVNCDVSHAKVKVKLSLCSIKHHNMKAN